MPSALATQLRKPAGFFGNLVAKMMEFRNRGSYNIIIDWLSPRPGDHILEIGYGPGLGIYQVARSVPGCRVSGIDFSELMYQKASVKNKKYIEKGNVHLMHGDILTIEPGKDKFDKIFCVNVIYFWNDLNLAFTKIINMLGKEGKFLIYMDHKDSLDKAKFLADFCKYPVEEVERELKTAGFARIEYIFEKGGYFISAEKSLVGNR
jgi:ubiquinone/menaquinone biosynthesis C-methylase UbiE